MSLQLRYWFLLLTATVWLVSGTKAAQAAPPGDDSTKTDVPGTFKFPVLKQHHIPAKFNSAVWNHLSVNIYGTDLTQFKDTFSIKLHDPSNDQPFVFPVPGHMTSGFGPRYFLGHTFHYGSDLALKKGDTVVAAMEGLIRVVRFDKYGYGHYIMIAHPNGLETLYGHLSKTLVTSGQYVKAGEAIGLGGSTGLSTGDHLHFEFRFLGEQFDPALVCDFKEQKLYKDEIKIDASWFKHLGKHKHAAPLDDITFVATKYQYHTLQPGESLYSVAQRFSTSVPTLCYLNNIPDNLDITAGWVIRVK